MRSYKLAMLATSVLAMTLAPLAAQAATGTAHQGGTTGPQRSEQRWQAQADLHQDREGLFEQRADSDLQRAAQDEANGFKSAAGHQTHDAQQQDARVKHQMAIVARDDRHLTQD